MTDHRKDDDLKDTYKLPTFEELLELKALGHKNMEELRMIWRSKHAAMSADERKKMETRFQLDFEKIAADFGKSRRLVIERDDDSDE